MIDRELLEWAAKAAGFLGWHHYGEEPYLTCWHGPTASDWIKWNPLTDDGDALRLAVKLHLWEAVRTAHRLVSDEVDIYAATRRAIVRAAAALAEPNVEG